MKFQSTNLHSILKRSLLCWYQWIHFFFKLRTVSFLILTFVYNQALMDDYDLFYQLLMIHFQGFYRADQLTETINMLLLGLYYKFITAFNKLFMKWKQFVKHLNAQLSAKYVLHRYKSTGCFNKVSSFSSRH